MCLKIFCWEVFKNFWRSYFLIHKWTHALKKKTVLLEKALRYDKSMDVIQKVRHSRKREEEVDKKGDEKYT